MDKETQARHAAYRDAARERYAAPSNDDVEVDEDAKVSEGDGGAFVQAWVWVRDSEAGLVDLEDEAWAAKREQAGLPAEEGESDAE